MCDLCERTICETLYTWHSLFSRAMKSNRKARQASVNRAGSQAWRLIPVSLALGRPRQEDSAIKVGLDLKLKEEEKTQERREEASALLFPRNSALTARPPQLDRHIHPPIPLPQTGYTHACTHTCTHTHSLIFTLPYPCCLFTDPASY